MQAVNLEQPGRALWWADGDLPRNGELKWGGSDRQFEHLRDAINFVLTTLSPSERGTALIQFDSEPGSLDFRKTEDKETARRLSRE